jgi:hypothetical protein
MFVVDYHKAEVGGRQLKREEVVSILNVLNGGGINAEGGKL